MDALVFGIPIKVIVLLIPLLPLIGALLNGSIALSCRNGRREVPKALVSVIGVGFPLMAFAVVLWVYALGSNPAEGFVTSPLWTWISAGDFSATISFKIDRLSLLMSLVVTGVGSLIHLYSVGYMADDSHPAPTPQEAEVGPRWGVSGGESGFAPRLEPKQQALPVRGGSGYARYFSYLNLFLFAMLILVLAATHMFLRTA